MALSRTIIKLAWVTRLLLWWIAFCDWITWGGGKKNAWQISKADALLPTGLNLQRATLMHFICSWADRVAIVSVFPGSHLKALNGQLFLTELDVRGEAGQLAPAELWSLAGQKSCQVSPMCVCVCACVLIKPCCCDNNIQIELGVGGCLGALTMFEYFCMFVFY